eukprot:gene10114-65711_t
MVQRAGDRVLPVGPATMDIEPATRSNSKELHAVSPRKCLYRCAYVNGPVPVTPPAPTPAGTTISTVCTQHTQEADAAARRAAESAEQADELREQ